MYCINVTVSLCNDSFTLSYTNYHLNSVTSTVARVADTSTKALPQRGVNYAVHAPKASVKIGHKFNLKA